MSNINKELGKNYPCAVYAGIELKDKGTISKALKELEEKSEDILINCADSFTTDEIMNSKAYKLGFIYALQEVLRSAEIAMIGQTDLEFSKDSRAYKGLMKIYEAKTIDIVDLALQMDMTQKNVEHIVNALGLKFLVKHPSQNKNMVAITKRGEMIIESFLKFNEIE